jgi:hypothetical protein
MIDQTRVRAVCLMAAMELVPPLVRDELLTDAKLRSDFNLELDAVLRFGDTSIAFKRSKLLAGVRAAGLTPGKAQKVLDLTGTEWEVEADTAKGTADLTIRAGSRVVHAGRFLLVTKNRNARRAYFEIEAERLNLPAASTARWWSILEKRPLTEYEIGDLMMDATQSPVAVAEMVKEHLSNAKISIDVLVPRSLEYYERLVGCIDGQVSITQYAAEVLPKHIRNLLSWRTADGLRQALLMGSHSLIANVIASERVSVSEFNKLAKWAVSSDPIALGATLELAISRAQDSSKIRANVLQLAKSFCGQGGEKQYDSYALLSAAFLMVDGELSKTRTLASKPPFWRRLAALSQAALISRCVLSTEGDLSKFVTWMSTIRLARYSMQCYADLRCEPRWLGDFAKPEQLKAEFGGRVFMAARRDENAIDKLKLRDVLLGDAPESLKQQLDMLAILFPGPLEGNTQAVNELAADHLEKMRTDLANTSPAISSFILTVNAALLFKIPDDIPGLAADAIRRAQHRLDVAGKPEALRGCLIGLAMVAAILRSTELADELFITVRSYRRFFPDELDVDDAFQIGMIACASRADLNDWCKCVGALIAGIGFGELSREDAEQLHALVIELCDIVPELWSACGQGLAAIEAVSFS